MSYKDDWEQFKAPVKQAKRNISNDIKRMADNISDTPQEEKHSKGKGCLKFVVYFMIAIVIISGISKCSDDGANTKEKPVETQAAQEETVQNEETNNENASENQNADKTVDAANDTAANDYGQNDCPYLIPQVSYAQKNNIKLNDFPKEQRALNKFINNDKYNEINVEDVGVLSQEYKMTKDKTKYIYHGELKDNRPDGYGALMKFSEYNHGLSSGYDIVYVGMFKEGSYDGYGMEFNIPEDAYEYSSFDYVCKYDKSSDEYFAYYLAWMNYVKYNGYFKNGKKDGKGNQYMTSLSAFTDMAAVLGSTDEAEFNNVRYAEINVGEFKNDTLNGNVNEYDLGLLKYSGEVHDDKKDGKGKTFFDSGVLEYDGEFKNDMRHGKGKLYDESGNLIYDGDWKYDDYK